MRIHARLRASSSRERRNPEKLGAILKPETATTTSAKPRTTPPVSSMATPEETLKRSGEQGGYAQKRNRQRTEGTDNAHDEQGHRHQRLLKRLLQVGNGELGLKFGESGDVAAEPGDSADHLLLGGAVAGGLWVPVSISQRRLISHPRSTPTPSAIPRARAGSLTMY